jgi:hypothetical protein
VFPNTPLQHYQECAQLQVLGNGNATPGPEYLASFPGAYSDSGMRISGLWQTCYLRDILADPGLNLSTYTFYNEDQMGNNTVYIIPGRLPRITPSFMKMLTEANIGPKLWEG